MATEHELVACPDCDNRGMVDGERCETCNGQGHVRKAATATDPDPAAATPKTPADAPKRTPATKRPAARKATRSARKPATA